MHKIRINGVQIRLIHLWTRYQPFIALTFNRPLPSVADSVAPVSAPCLSNALGWPGAGRKDVSCAYAPR